MLWALGLVSFLPASAQQSKYNLTGKVIDSESRSLNAVPVYLLRAADSSLIKAALTNAEGVFVFDNIGSGIYIINIATLGYAKRLLGPVNLSADTDMGLIKLQKNNTLRQVDIVSKGNFIEVKPGKVILNISKSILSAGNNAFDVLSTAPGVKLDADGNISLYGKDVTVMINNKRVYLTPDALAELLRNTPSSQIGQIELITNPSAAWDAEGNGGIINIKMVRNKTIGLSGTVFGSYGVADIVRQYGNPTKWSSGFNLDYNIRRMSLFGGFSHNDNIADRVSTIDRTVYDPMAQQVHTDYFNSLNDRNNNLRLGMDYNLDAKHVVGFLFNGLYSNYDYDKNTTTALSNYNMPDSAIISRSAATRRLLTYTFNLNYKADMAKYGQLSAGADYSVYDRKPFENIYSNYYNPNNVLYRSAVLQNVMPSLFHIYAFKAEDDIKLGKTSSIQAEIKTSYVTNNNTSNFGNVINNQYLPDARFSNMFDYSEAINAAALVYYSAINRKTSFELGLRAEQTITNGHVTPLNGNAQPVDQGNYVDLFPSVQLTTTTSNNNQLLLSYGRRIKRPVYTDLNPFLSYQNEYNYYEGNINLKPQYANNIQLTDTYKQNLNVTLQASFITNYIFLTTLPGNIISQKVNFGNNYIYSAVVNQLVDLNPWWNVNINLDASIQHFDNAYQGSSYMVNTRDLIVNVKQQFNVFNQLKAEVLGIYESPHAYGIYNVQASCYFDAGVSKSLFNKRGNLQFQVADVFNSNRSNFSTNYQNLNFNGYLQTAFRTYQLTFSYSFGNPGRGERQDKLGSDQEQSRAAGGN